MNVPDYTSPEAPVDPRPPRSAGTWVALAIVWTLGVASWMVYIALGVALLYRIF